MSQPTQGRAGRMAIELVREVKVHCFHIVAEIGFAQRRDEIRAVVQLAADQASQLTARAVCQHLLGGKPDAVGLRLIAVCEQLGLFEWESKSRRGDTLARLTEEGRKVAQGGEVFVPARGTWTIWVAEDPLIPLLERLLRVEPFREPSAFDEVMSKNKPREQRQALELPEWVQKACSVYGKLAWGDGQAISVIDIEDRAELVEAEARVMLSLLAAPGQPSSLRLSGQIQNVGADYELQQAPAPDFNEVWRTCLGRSASDWDGSKLAVRFERLDNAERASFESHLSFKGWSHPIHGEFGAFQVPHVPLRPATDLDASLWANWRLLHRTQSYVRRADFARHCDEVRQTFAGYRLQLMAQEQLASSARRGAGGRPGRKYWYLQAPLDWAL